MKYLFFFLFTSFAISQESLDLSKAIKIALENNYQIKLAEKNTEIAENNNNLGNAGFLPTLSASGNYNISQQSGRTELPSEPGQPNTIIAQDAAGRTQLGASVTLNWTLFDGFAMFTNYNRLNLLEENSQIQFQLAVENNIREVITNYVSLINTLKNLDNLKKSIEISRDRLSLAEDKLQYGSVSGAAVLQAKVDLNADSSSILQTEIELANIERALKYSMGIKSDRKFIYERELEYINLGDIEELREKLFERNSSINLAINQSRISQRDRELIVSQFYPRVDLTAGYQYSSTANDEGFPLFSESYGPNVGLNAQFNLFDANRRFRNLENADINMEIADIQIEDVKASIEFNLLNLFDTYQRQNSLIELEESNLETAKENLQRSDNAFELGNLTSIEFREAQLNLLLAQNRFSNIKASKKQTESLILLLIGELPE